MRMAATAEQQMPLPSLARLTLSVAISLKMVMPANGHSSI